MRYLHKYRKYFLIALFPAICWLFINNSINRHFHQLQSGQIITHAHPYQKEKSDSSPFQSHHHSDFELLILDLVSNLVVIIIAAAPVGIFHLLIKEIKIRAAKIFAYSEPYNIQKYRGPPALV